MTVAPARETTAGRISAGEPTGAASPSLEALALPLLAGTQAAALACVRWAGRGDKNAADQAAVAAMRASFATLPAAAVVVIGEGEKDDAPMLHVGERLGTAPQPAVELAVDPLEGTNFCATGREGAIAVVACAPAGSLWSARDAFYMDKIVVGPQAAGVVDIDAPVADNLAAVARATGKRVSDLVVVMLAKPRHVELIAAVRQAGARVLEVTDGDVAGALTVLLPGGNADLLLGVGGAPEGVIMACAARLLGGEMLGRLAPQSDQEAARLREAGVDIGEVLTLSRLAGDGDCVVAATGVTGGILQRVARTRDGWRTESLLMTPAHPALIVSAEHAAPRERTLLGRRSVTRVAVEAPPDAG